MSEPELKKEYRKYVRMYDKLDNMDPLRVNLSIFENQIIPALERKGFEFADLYDEKLMRKRIHDALPEGVSVKEKPFKEGHIAEYEVIEPVGSGAFGTVFKAKRGDKVYAVKEIHYPNGIQTWDVEGSWVVDDSINKEIQMLKKASSIEPRITAKFHEAFVGPHLKNLYLVLDYVNCGTLDDWTREHELTPEDIAKLKDLVKRLHEHRIYHQDLHMSNILVECKENGKPNFLLSDFGISKSLKNLEERDYHWIDQLGNTNNSINKKTRHYTPETMIRELILYDILINNHIRLI